MKTTRRGFEHGTVTHAPLGNRSTEGLIAGLAVVPAFLALLAVPTLLAGGAAGVLAFVGFRKLQSMRETALLGRRPPAPGCRHRREANGSAPHCASIARRPLFR